MIHKPKEEKKTKETVTGDQYSMNFQTRPNLPYMKRFDMTVTNETTKLCKEPV